MVYSLYAIVRTLKGKVSVIPYHLKIISELVEKEWERLQDLSKNRKAHGSILFKGRIYIFFGRSFPDEFEK